MSRLRPGNGNPYLSRALIRAGLTLSVLSFVAAVIAVALTVTR